MLGNFSLKLLREKFENALHLSGKTEEINFLKNVATLILTYGIISSQP